MPVGLQTSLLCKNDWKNLQGSVGIIVSFHSTLESLKYTANALTIYSVSLNLLKLTAGLKASGPRLDQSTEGETSDGALPWLIASESEQL